MANRHLARSVVLQVLFERDSSGGNMTADEALSRLTDYGKEFGARDSDMSFMKALLSTVVANNGYGLRPIAMRMNKQRLFTASCIALIATAMSFAIRGDIMGDFETIFALNKTNVGWIAEVLAKTVLLLMALERERGLPR